MLSNWWLVAALLVPVAGSSCLGAALDAEDGQ
jgi:hypothetical protein